MLDLHSLSVSYDEHLALDHVSLSVQPGEVLAVIGPNGAGKSSLIRATSGVLPICSGKIRIAGQEMTRLSPDQRARYLAVVPQARSLPGAFTVYQTVLLGRTPYLGWLGRPRQTDHERVLLALEQTATLALRERPVTQLSGGEQQRVLLARSLAQNAPILLLDEPTTHLDLRHQSSFLNLLRELASECNLAVLMTLHDINLTALYADQVALLKKGCIYAKGAPIEVLTAANLTTVYDMPVQVMTHPDYGTPLILPNGRIPRQGIN